MAYIGKEPIVGNFQKCDAITVVNGQAAYTLQVSSTNVVPESAKHMLVTLNGILQAPLPSFTVSGSTLTFASNLATGDVIDFVILLGNVLDLGVPSDSTVSLAKLTATGTKDATTFLRGDNTFASAGGDNTPAFEAVIGTNQTISDVTETKVTFQTENFDTDNAYDNSTNYRFTPQTAGKYFCYAQVRPVTSGSNDHEYTLLRFFKNGTMISQTQISTYPNRDLDSPAITHGRVFTLNGSSDYIEVFVLSDGGGSMTLYTSATENSNVFGAFKLIT